MRILSKRRFPDTIIRRRALPGTRNEFGEFVDGAVRETELRANVQPLSIKDADFVGGAQTEERLKVYVPSAEVETIIESDTLTWNGEKLAWGDAPLSWGTVLQDEAPGVALRAAFDDSTADNVVVGAFTFVIEESRYWPRSHTRAILLRET